MSESTHIDTRRRSKRNRTSAFDASRISVQPLPKYRKRNNVNKMAQQGQPTDPSIIDMSHTINRSNRDQLAGNSNRFMQRSGLPHFLPYSGSKCTLTDQIIS